MFLQTNKGCKACFAFSNKNRTVVSIYPALCLIKVTSGSLGPCMLWLLILPQQFSILTGRLPWFTQTAQSVSPPQILEGSKEQMMAGTAAAHALLPGCLDDREPPSSSLLSFFSFLLRALGLPFRGLLFTRKLCTGRYTAAVSCSRLVQLYGRPILVSQTVPLAGPILLLLLG